MIAFTQTDIRRHFGGSTFDRARGYASARKIAGMRRAERADGKAIMLNANVRGSERVPYNTRVIVERKDDGKLSFDTSCSCPVGDDCKHAAAMLLYHLELVAEEENSDAEVAELVALAKQGGVMLTPAMMKKMLFGKNKEKPVKDSSSRVATLPAPESTLSPVEEQWLRTLEQAATKSVPAADDLAPVTRNGNSSSAKRVLMTLSRQGHGGGEDTFLVRFHSAPANHHPRNAGEITSYEDYYLSNPQQHPKFFTDEDRTLIAALKSLNYRLGGLVAETLLPTLLATGRLYWNSLLESREPLSWSDTIHHAAPEWQILPNGHQKPVLTVTGVEDSNAIHLIAGKPAWYVDTAQNTVGKVTLGVPMPVLQAMLQAPSLNATAAAAVRERFQALPAVKNNGLALSAPRSLITRKRRADSIVPHLKLEKRPAYTLRYGWQRQNLELAVASLFFQYDSRIVPYGDSTPITLPMEGDTITTLMRQGTDESRHVAALRSSGMTSLKECMRGVDIHIDIRPHNFAPKILAGRKVIEVDDEADAWADFMLEQVPALRRKGWHIEIDKDFPFNFRQPDEWYAEMPEGSGIDWLELHVGVEVDGQKVDLVPAMLKLMRGYKANGYATAAEFIQSLDGHRRVAVKQADGSTLLLPAERVIPLLRFLLNVAGSGNEETLKISRYHAVDLLELEASLTATQARWFTSNTLRQLGQALKENGNIPAVPKPEGLKADLRPYQHDGLNWLQFLKNNNMSGILADDMGLGKTIQALSYILTEKNAGTLKGKPILVVCPTSLVFNWQNEAEKFCPSLKVLALHGLDRRKHFDAIRDTDMVITTYPLLAFDKEILLKHHFHTIFLDEAQYIKNARAKSTLIVCQLQADHRFCLTGTPLENHLGEVWSQFNFMMPGFLGDASRFQRDYRNPIEKKRDSGAQQHLLSRIRPFLLRRTKEEVAKELPPKTEMVQYCEMAPAQRTVYEAIRLRMHKKVRDEIASKGLARSQIILLDALLKLRQICCHPPLLKSDEAKKVDTSAKRETLHELLENLLDEGRKIVLFSQFVEMLDVLEADLKEKKIPYVMLTGQSKNRGELVKQFQEGNARIFLVSLKAGGTGLNLTAADTVIHYDPWWNPAAEKQAADRVYRIGQDKPVFVYKLIARDSVEEKILQLQQRKQELADSLFAEGGEAMAKLSDKDVEALLAA